MESNKNTHTKEIKETQTTADNAVVMSILSYIGILVLIPLLSAKNNEIVKFHVRQGLVLLVLEVAIWIISEMVWILNPILNIVEIVIVILSIVGIVNVLHKKQVALPLIGQFAKYFTI